MHNGITHFLGEALPSSSTVGNGLTFPFLSAPQSYSFGLGGTLSSTASRTDKYDPYYTVAALLDTKRMPYKVCEGPEQDPFVKIDFQPAKSSLLVEDDLGIKEWLVGAMFTNQQIPSSKEDAPKDKAPCDDKAAGSLTSQRVCLLNKGYTPAEITQIVASRASPSSSSSGGGGSSGGASGGTSQKPDTVSIEIKFVVVTNGNVSPTWKLVRVSANTGSNPLFSAGRTRTHDLIITIGPPTQATANSHLAQVYGNTIGNAVNAKLVQLNGGF